MTIEFLPWDVSPSSPIWHYQENFEAIERIFPLDADWIARVWAGAIDWSDGTIVPLDNLPQELRDLLTGGGGTLLTDLSFAVGLSIQWCDNTSLYVPPGQVAHRGRFKRQGFDEATSAIRIIDVTASLRDPVADGDPGTTSGLAADTPYYVYAKLDVATGFPEYRVSQVAPTNEEGYGREHPAETGLRFLGSFRTGAAPDAYIRPFHRSADDWVTWRAEAVGPYEPTNNLITTATGGFVDLPLDDHVPPTADMVRLAVQFCPGEGARNRYFRVLGDSGDVGFRFNPDDGGGASDRDVADAVFDIPVNAIDPATDEPATPARVEINLEVFDADTDFVAVVGYHEPR